MKNKIKEVAFVSQDLKKSYDNLKENDENLYKFINRAINDLKENPFYGIRIKKKLIPKNLNQKFGIDNLWKYNLPNAWRLLYTLVGDEVKIVSIVLDWMNHKDYERLFKF